MSDTTKTFTIAGVSTKDAKTKVRFGNEGRVKTLEKTGHTEIRMIDLDTEMTKGEIVKMLFTHADFQDDVAQDAVVTYVVNNAKDVAVELGLTTVTTSLVEEAEVVEVDAEQAKRDARNARRRELRAQKKAAAEATTDFEF